MRRVANPELEPDFYAMVPAGLSGTAMLLTNSPYPLLVPQAISECTPTGLQGDEPESYLTTCLAQEDAFSTEPLALPMNTATKNGDPCLRANEKIGNLRCLSMVKAHQEQAYRSISLENLLSIFPAAMVGAYDDKFDIDTTFPPAIRSAAQTRCGTANEPIQYQYISPSETTDMFEPSEIGDWVMVLLNEEEDVGPAQLLCLLTRLTRAFLSMPKKRFGDDAHWIGAVAEFRDFAQ